MASQITIEQLWDSAELTLQLNKCACSESSATLKYVVSGATNEQEAINLVYAAAPEKLTDDSGYLPKKSASIDERCGEDTWKVSVSYSHGSEYSYDSDEEETESDGNSDNLPEVCFQCNAGTAHVTQALGQVCVYQRNGVPTVSNVDSIPIGWNGKCGTEMQASGIDIKVAETREQYTRILKYDTIRSSAYRRKIASLVGKINASEFKGWKAGEAMFVGMSYTTPQRGAKKVKCTFDFEIKPNEHNAQVCGINIGDLHGHAYAWAVTGNSYGNGVNPVIDYLFKCQVSGYADFSQLGL